MRLSQPRTRPFPGASFKTPFPALSRAEVMEHRNRVVFVVSHQRKSSISFNTLARVLVYLK